MKKFLRIVLGILLAVIALNAFGGGYYGMAGAENVPPEWLNGSPFKSYFLPSLFLFIVIGGTCLAASVAAFKNSRYSRQLAFISGALLIAWIGAQVSIIGYVSWMQPAIFISAIVIIFIAYILPKKKSRSCFLKGFSLSLLLVSHCFRPLPQPREFYRRNPKVLHP